MYFFLFYVNLKCCLCFANEDRFGEGKKNMYVTIAAPGIGGTLLSYDCSSDAVIVDVGQISLWHVQNDVVSTVLREKLYLDISKMKLVPEPVTSNLYGWSVDVVAYSDGDEHTGIWKYESNPKMMPNATADFFPDGWCHRFD